MSTSEIMTVKQLAENLQMSRITVCRLAGGKKLPYLGIGKELQFPKELVDRFVTSDSGFDEVFDGIELIGGEQN